MKTWKRWLAVAEVICLCLCGTACGKVKKEDSRFGMDLNVLNPLVMTATDSSSGDTVFSRDVSVISEVMNLFEKMKLTPSNKTDNRKGITFIVSTMSGNFLFGECCGDELKLDEKNYTLDRDYSNDIKRLYERLESETANTGNVTRSSILSVTPDMTYKQILSSFGPTLETAVVGKNKAYLYKYGNRPFYIAFDKITDTVGISGQKLMQAIWDDYNLGNCLTAPTPLNYPYLSAYETVFDKVVDQYRKQAKIPVTAIMIDTYTLTLLSNQDRQALLKHFQDKYSLKVLDSGETSLIAAGDSTGDTDSGRLVLWINYYTYISAKQLNFVAAGKQEGQDSITVNAQETAGTVASK